ncbi:MAG: hypothetical protein ACREHC_06200 [Candidatus Levyibacteriota bacterium]
MGIFLTLITTWPLIFHLTTYLPNGGDNVVETWILWYDQYALSIGRIFNQTLYFNGPQFYPLPYTIAYSDNLFLLSFVFAPFYWLVQNIPLWINSITLSTFIFCFCTSYYVLRKVSHNSYASIIGAFVFTFNPITFAHFEPGHINLLSKYFFPVEFYFAYRAMTKPSWKNVCLFFLFFTLNALSSIYFAIFTILSLPLFFLPTFLERVFKRDGTYFKKLLFYSLSGLLFLLFLMYFMMPYLQFSTKENVVRTINESIYYSAQPIDFVASLPINFIYGPWVRYLDRSSFYYGHTLSLDLVPVILACFGLLFLFNQRRKIKEIRSILGLFLVALFSLIMMFGPFWDQVKLPYYYLYTYLPLPLLQSIRAPARFEFLFYMPFALCAAFGMLFLLKNIKTQAFMITGVILFLLIIENLNSNAYNEKNTALLQIANYNANTHVHAILDKKIMLNYPILDPNQDKTAANYLLWGMFFHASIMNGNTGYLPPDLLDFLGKFDLSQKKDLDALKAIGVQNILIHKDKLTTPLQLKKYANMLIYDDDTIAILDVTRFQSSTRYCTKQDLQYSITTPAKIIDSEPMSYIVTIKNNNDCYVVNKYNDRYVKAIVKIDNRNYINYLKFPIFIAPHQSSLISEPITNYKNQFDYLKAGKLYGDITIPELDIKSAFMTTNSIQ